MEDHPLDLLRHYAREGNRDFALQRASGEVRAVIRQERVVAPAVFAPLVERVQTDRSISARVSVELDRDHSEVLDSAAIESIEGALDDAWHGVAGHGDRPRLGVRLPLAEAAGHTVGGPSLALATLLSAVTALTGQKPRRSVLVTGGILKSHGAALRVIDSRDNAPCWDNRSITPPPEGTIRRAVVGPEGTSCPPGWELVKIRSSAKAGAADFA